MSKNTGVVALFLFLIKGETEGPGLSLSLLRLLGPALSPGKHQILQEAALGQLTAALRLGLAPGSSPGIMGACLILIAAEGLGGTPLTSAGALMSSQNWEWVMAEVGLYWALKELGP